MKATFFALYSVSSSYHQSRAKSRLTVHCYEQETTIRLFELMLQTARIMLCSHVTSYFMVTSCLLLYRIPAAFDKIMIVVIQSGCLQNVIVNVNRESFVNVKREHLI